MQFVLFYPNDFQKIFRKTTEYVKNLKMTQIAGGWGVMFFVLLWRNAYENCYVIHPLLSPSSIKYALFLKLLVFLITLVEKNFFILLVSKLFWWHKYRRYLRVSNFSRKYVTAIASSDGGKCFSRQFLCSLSPFSNWRSMCNPKIYCLISGVTNTGSYCRM